MTNLIRDIKGKLESAYLEAPFDKAKAELESQKYEIISLSENARLRMQEGKDAFISQNGNYTREGVIYLPSKEIYLTKSSSIMKNAEEATECHRKGKEFYLNEKQIAKSLKDAVKFPKNDNYAISTDKFGEDAITDFAFGKIAKDYGLFLKEAGIKEMPVYLVNLKDKAFARQMWFGWLSAGRSDLNGYDRSLNGGSSRARGVRSLASEASTQKISEAYTPKQISKALKRTGLKGIEEILLEELKK